MSSHLLLLVTLLASMACSKAMGFYIPLAQTMSYLEFAHVCVICRGWYPSVAEIAFRCTYEADFSSEHRDALFISRRHRIR